MTDVVRPQSSMTSFCESDVPIDFCKSTVNIDQLMTSKTAAAERGSESHVEPVMAACDGGNCGAAERDDWDEELEEEEKQRILRRLPSVSLPGVQWTTCIFDPSRCVVIRYCHDNEAAKIGVEEIRRELISSLEPPPGCTIKPEQLRRKPICKKTFQPGDAVTDTLGSIRTRRIGAYVSVDGAGLHALTTGHGLSEGQRIQSPENEPLGTVKAVLCSHDIVVGSCEAAIVKVDDGVPVTASVRVGDDGPRRRRWLSPTTRRPRSNELVQKFCDRPESVTGLVVHHDYSNMVDGPARCMAIVVPGEETFFHGEGESGVVVTTRVPRTNGVNGVDGAEEVVQAIGMLMSTEFIETNENEARGESRISLAASLGESLHQMSAHPYCNNVEPRLIGRTSTS